MVRGFRKAGREEVEKYNRALGVGVWCVRVVGLLCIRSRGQFMHQV